ncbi:MAG: hypothetical protein KDM64_03995 [Verrucomicrobiae bacterium]|nr:hypothetical protein [Verrucomicrobiae bacterium]
MPILEPPQSEPFAASKGGIFRGLAIPFSAFVLAGSLALVWWIDWSYRRESLRQFEQTAVANARIIEQMRLPRSPELAKNLATVLGVGVGFRFEGREPSGLPPELVETINRLTGHSPAAAKVGGREVAVAPLADGEAHLVLIRDERRSAQGILGWLLPSLIVTALGGGIAFLIARRIVGPLGALNRWLPNLDREVPAPIPNEALGRQDEIGALARSLEEGQRRLREEQALRRQSERMATLGRIATSLAHEIRNPAAAIRLHAEVLARETAAGASGSVELIREEVDRITDLVNQWLYVARSAPPRTERHDLAELVERVLRRLAPQMEHAGVRASVEHGGPAEIRADASRIEQVLRNLLVNAIQAMPEGGQVEVRLRRGDQGIDLEILDQGRGFSEDALRRWREAFFSEREGGMGLGLTLASEVMQGHGGSVEVENRPDGGAVVRCHFPPLAEGSELS